MRLSIRPLALAAGLALLAACTPMAKKPSTPFMAYGPAYASKPDLARVEHTLALTPEQRLELTPANLATLKQEELDQIYARLTAGPIPDGPHQGTVLFADGGGLRRLREILGGVKGFVADLGVDKLERFAGTLWKGKVFYRDDMVLRNQITHRRALARLFKAPVTEMRTETINGRKVALLFPAKLYCGQSLLDSRKESVIIDYFFGDEIDGYVPQFDYIAGREGLQIRDEIRMIRPGFYLGRAYIGKIFLLNFTLYKQDVAEAGKAQFASTGKAHEDCRPGAPQVARSVGP